MQNNRAYQFSVDDEWYTTKDDVRHFLDKADIPREKIIWCPFDVESSNFVTVLKEYGYHVEHSHLQDDKDFYKYEPKEWDIIISNPPFKNKHNILIRLLEFNKPWALIFGIQALNSEKFCDSLQKFQRVQYIHLKRRMCFVKDHLNYDINNLNRPSFASLWICNRLIKGNDIQIWDGVNYKKDNKEFC
jgi:hypothetical protein